MRGRIFAAPGDVEVVGVEEAVVTDAAVDTNEDNEGEGLVVESGQLGDSLFELVSTLIGNLATDTESSSSSFPGSMVVSTEEEFLQHFLTRKLKFTFRFFG